MHRRMRNGTVCARPGATGTTLCWHCASARCGTAIGGRKRAGSAHPGPVAVRRLSFWLGSVPGGPVPGPTPVARSTSDATGPATASGMRSPPLALARLTMLSQMASVLKPQPYATHSRCPPNLIELIVLPRRHTGPTPRDRFILTATARTPPVQRSQSRRRAARPARAVRARRPT